MRPPLYLFLLSLFVVVSNKILAQDTSEAVIRRLENAEREAVLQSDSAALFNKLWSPHMVIHNPLNTVGTVEGTKQLLRNGRLRYLSFERNIEKVTFIDDVAIVMGGEVVKPQGTQPNAGKTVHRRFTHVWKRSDNSWSIIARQATIIKIE